jgi:cyclopropane-fatty-acyl-phospholipid synthase
MRVAVVGAGVSGLAAAHELALGGARVTVYDKEDCLGGHARTVAVEDAAAGTVHLDLGFMVFNRVRTIHCSPAAPRTASMAARAGLLLAR